MKKKEWFREFGWIYIPNSWQGYFLTAIIVIFNISAFIVIDRNSHSVNDTFFGIFPYLVPSFGMLLWIAAESSKKRK